MEHHFISQDLITFSRIISVFVLICFLLKYREQIKRKKRIIFILLILIIATCIIYIITSYIGNQTNVLYVLVPYIYVKMSENTPKSKLLSKVPKSAIYLVLGVLNLFFISKSDPKSTIVVAYFVSAMFFIESIDNFFDYFNKNEKHDNTINK